MIKSAEKEYIFAPDTVTKSCHASTVLPLGDGRVLAAWFGGKREKDNSVEIYCSVRSRNAGWGEPECVSGRDDVAHWNPVLHERGDGTILLFYKRGAEISQWKTFFIESPDGGSTWSAPRELVPGDGSGGRGPVKNKCVKTKEGLLIAPASSEKNRLWLPFFDLSEDEGYTWTRTPLLERPKYKGANVHLIQPSVWQDPAGALHCFIRSDKGALYRSDSCDGGRTWRKPYRTRLPNNNSGVDCCTDAHGRLWLAYNPVAENWGVRHPLTLSCSDDNGMHFTPILSPETGFGEFSYPALVYRDGALHLTYTYKRKQIVYWKITLEDCAAV